MASSGALEEPAKSRGSFRTSVLGTGGRTESFVPLYRLERSVQLKRRLPPPLLQTGLASLQGVRDGARGWREKGKSLGGRRAGPAASPSRDSRLSACSLCAWLGLGRAVRRDPRPSLGAPLLLRPRARRGAAKLRRAAEPFRAAGALAVVRCSVWPEDWRGRKGKAGTHTRRGARALHTRSRALPPRRVRGEFGPATQAPAPAHSARSARPRPRLSDPAASRLHCSSFARG